mmetsp:Transcript_40272/g.59740  ORF Transcript_40272/g.59740 Transcript_40272/m.59740 type:complete len:139 (-) Transcript_40272:240-656(-)
MHHQPQLLLSLENHDVDSEAVPSATGRFHQGPVGVADAKRQGEIRSTTERLHQGSINREDAERDDEVQGATARLYQGAIGLSDAGRQEEGRSTTEEESYSGGTGGSFPPSQVDDVLTGPGFLSAHQREHFLGRRLLLL